MTVWVAPVPAAGGAAVVVDGGGAEAEDNPPPNLAWHICTQLFKSVPQLAYPEPYEGAAVVVAAADEAEVVVPCAAAVVVWWPAAAEVVVASCPEAEVEVDAWAFAADVEVASCIIADDELATAGAGSETEGSELIPMGTARTALESTRAEKIGAKIRTIMKTLRTKETRTKVIRVQKMPKRKSKG